MILTQAPTVMEKEGSASSANLTSREGLKTAEVTRTAKAVVDTSAPFESVKEAVDRFGGSAIWKSQLKQPFNPDKHHSAEDFELMNVQEQIAQLEKDIVMKERETLEVIKELERTKRTVDRLKIHLHDELSEANKFPEIHTDDLTLHPVIEPVHVGMQAAHSTGSVLFELSQAKMNLSRKSSGLADIQASIETLHTKLEEEKALLEKNREKLSSRKVTISSLQEDLKQMTLKLQLMNPASMSVETKNLFSEREHLRKAMETDKSEVLRITSEIEQINVSIKAAEIRWLVAKKMEEAAKATEATALAQSKALINNNNNNNNNSDSCLQNHTIVLSIEDYSILTDKIQEADESSRKKIEYALLEVERGNKSKLELMLKIEEAAEDVKNSKKFLEEAMNRADAANQGKLAVEESLRRWRSEHGQRRRYIHNSTKFKNSYLGHQRQDTCRMVDLNGFNLMNDDPSDGLNHTLSIGEILSRKLVGPVNEDYDTAITERSNKKVKVSLGQILNRRPGVVSPQNGCGSARKQHPTMRKRFGFVLFSRLLRNERLKSMKKKKKSKKRQQISGSGEK